MKYKMKYLLFYNIERAFLNNITRVVIYLILLLITFQLVFKLLEIWYFISTIWAIVAFWYWYKKYERDKELEVVEKYTEKYNTLVENLYKNRTRTNYRKLFNLYWEEFFLKSKWYISDELWEQWEYWIRSDLNREFKKEQYKNIWDKLIKENPKNSRDFFKHLFYKSWVNIENSKINWKSFYDYFIN
jgi:hypothetical protein